MRIGILGGGQLARMLALAGYPLDFEFAILSPDRHSCAAPVARHFCAEYSDEAALLRLANWSDVVTFEFENVPFQALQSPALQSATHPGVESLRLSQDRLLEKQLFSELKINCARFKPVDTLESLQQAVRCIGLPAVLKSRWQGYDGKGQTVIRSFDSLATAWRLLDGQPGILEELVPFQRELSLVAVRSTTGETACYAVSENFHHDGILRLAVSRPHDPLQEQAAELASRLVTRLNHVGVLALEFFQVGENLLANEYAPRVHNTGHWTIEGAATSQFENHLRAISGLPLGSTTSTGVAATLNLIGSVPDRAAILGLENVHLHLYGKACKPGRKVGHITVRARSELQLQQVLRQLLAVVGNPDLAWNKFQLFQENA